MNGVAIVKGLPMPDTLLQALNLLHDEGGLIEHQTIRGGTQVNLAGCQYKAPVKLLRSLRPEICRHVQDYWVWGGAWSSRMGKGGYHVEHAHPKGFVSGVYYVAVGQGADLLLDGQSITPEVGMLVLFPSHFQHGTNEYMAETPRLTVAFDLARE